MEKWNSNDIEDLTGRTVLITGGSSGLGFETARVMAKKNAAVVIAVRDAQKAKTAINEIMADSPGADVSSMLLDLADLSSVRDFAKSFLSAFDHLDLLINNAGIMVPPYGKTHDGFELQMGTNHLGHFALTGLLFKLINETPGSRIINVSSMAHRAGNLRFEDLHWEKRRYKKWNAYGDSKIANLYFTFALNQKLAASHSRVIAAAAHPGYTDTRLQRHTGLFSALNHVLAQHASMGALPTLYAATAPDVRGGDFFGPSGFLEMRGYPKRVNANKRANSAETADKLWNVSQELTGITFC